MIESILSIRGEVVIALYETFYMVAIALLSAIIFGTVLGLILYVTSNPLFVKNTPVNRVIGIILNVIRSVPFLILMVLLLPLSKLVVGTKIGSEAVVVPLSIASTAFLARLAEASFSDVSNGVVEAFLSTGASKFKIITKILLPEALP